MIVWKYLKNILLGIIDQGANVLMLGDRDLSVSARVGFAIYFPGVKPRYEWVNWIAKALNFIQHNHVAIGWEELERNAGTLWRWYVVHDQKKFTEAIKTLSIARATIRSMSDKYMEDRGAA